LVNYKGTMICVSLQSSVRMNWIFVVVRVGAQIILKHYIRKENMTCSWKKRLHCY